MDEDCLLTEVHEPEALLSYWIPVNMKVDMYVVTYILLRLKFVPDFKVSINCYTESLFIV